MSLYKKNTVVIYFRVDNHVWMIGHFLSIFRLWIVPLLLLLDPAQLARLRLVITRYR
jgi:hypothetical protein